MKTSLLLFCMLGVAPVLTLASDIMTIVPVHFCEGANSTTINGSFKGYGSVIYTLSAKAGQHMEVDARGNSNANFNLFAPGDKPGVSTFLGSGFVGRDWSGELPASGIYSVQVFQTGSSARREDTVAYNIHFAIE